MVEGESQDVIALFQSIEEKFPHKSLGDDKWYLVVISALLGFNPSHVATLYTYLMGKPEFTEPEDRKALTRRIREALVENVPIQGVCKPLEAIFGIMGVEKPEDIDYSFSRENWQSGPENLARGNEWLNTIYKHNITSTDDRLAAHKDFNFINHQITYGLYLSDMSILGPVDTEMVVLSGIMIQNLPLETGWHLRGTRRVGVSSEDVEIIQQCIETIAAFGGISVHRVPRVADIEHEV